MHTYMYIYLTMCAVVPYSSSFLLFIVANAFETLHSLCVY
jgi:hypothetical protein